MLLSSGRAPIVRDVDRSLGTLIGSVSQMLRTYRNG
jgi:hypothetical protein